MKTDQMEMPKVTAAPKTTQEKGETTREKVIMKCDSATLRQQKKINLPAWRVGHFQPLSSWYSFRRVALSQLELGAPKISAGKHPILARLSLHCNGLLAFVVILQW